MQSQCALALSDTSEFYSTKANQLEREGELLGAARFYLMAGRATLALASAQTGESQAANLKRAEKLLAKARALREPGNESTAYPTAHTANAAHSSAKPASLREPRHSQLNQHTALARPALNPAEVEPPESHWQPALNPGVSFADIAGLDDAKRTVCERVILPMRRPELFQRYGLRPGGGVLLYGLPGTGKTTFAKAVASECGATFYQVACSDITSKWLGESERNVAALFERAARDKAAVIFFDDFDGLGALRGEQAGAMNRIVAELLMRMQGFSSGGHSILLLAATNRPWAVDSAFLRAGRFGERIYVPLPNADSRQQLMGIQLRDVPLSDDIDLAELAGLTAGRNGADIAEVCELAKLAAALRACALSETDDAEANEPVTHADFMRAIERHPSSVNRQDIALLTRYIRDAGLAMPAEM